MHTHINTHTKHTHTTPTDGRANVPLSKSIDIEPIGMEDPLAGLDGGECLCVYVFMCVCLFV